MNKRILTITLVSLLVMSVLTLIGSAPGAKAQVERIPREQYWGDFYATGYREHFNPIFAAIVGGTAGIEDVYEPLAVTDIWRAEYCPVLAKDWGFTDEYTFEIHIQPEAYFRDGSPVLAEDVAFSLRTHSNPKWGGFLSGTFGIYVESITATDEKTVQIKLKKEYPHNLNALQFLRGTIFPRDRWSRLLEKYGENIIEYKNDDPKEHNGSGPYELMALTKEKIITRRVENYWGENLGWYFLPEYHVVYNLVDSTTRWLKFKEDDYEMITGWVPVSMPYTDANPDIFDWWNKKGKTRLEKYENAPIGASIIVPNYEKLSLVKNNIWLRKALAYAIDQEAQVEKTQGGCGGPTPPNFLSPLVPKVREYTNTEVIEKNFETTMKFGVPVIKYDPEKAVEILKEHCEGSVEKGWWYPNKETGEKIGPWTIETVNGWVNWMGTIRMTAKAWSDIGIETKANFLDYGLWAERFNNLKFDWIISGTAGVSPLSPYNLFDPLFAPFVSTWIGSRMRYNQFFPEHAKEIQELLGKLWSLPIGSEESIEVAKKIQEIYVPELPAIPTWFYVRHVQWYTTHWVNEATKDDPYNMTMVYAPDGARSYLQNVYPASVKTMDFTLFPEVVKAGELTTAQVTLKNEGNYDQRYAVYVRKGPAKLGPGPEILARACVIVPAGGTRTAELEVTLDEPGSYTLTVDDWRIGETNSNPGDPIERTLVVTEP